MPWRDWIRTVEVEPSIYAADMAHLGEQIQHLLNAGARLFHFDVGDGHFVEPITIGPVVLRAIAPAIHAVGGVIDVHLMVTNPEHHFEQMKAAGGDSVTFHVEATEEPGRRLAWPARTGSQSASRSIPRRRCRTPWPPRSAPTWCSA